MSTYNQQLCQLTNIMILKELINYNFGKIFISGEYHYKIVILYVELP